MKQQKNYPYNKVTEISSIKNMMELAVTEAGDKPAFKYKDNNKSIKTVTYREFMNDTIYLGTALSSIGAGSSHIAVIGENSYKIVTSTEIIGISHKQRMMVANIVRYPIHNFQEYREFEDYFSQEDYLKIAQLNAILRLADAMDRSHKQKFGKLTVTSRNNTLFLTGHTLYDITLEKGIFARYSVYFEEIFGLHPVLSQKKEF